MLPSHLEVSSGHISRPVRRKSAWLEQSVATPRFQRLPPASLTQTLPYSRPTMYDNPAKRAQRPSHEPTKKLLSDVSGLHRATAPLSALRWKTHAPTSELRMQRYPSSRTRAMVHGPQPVCSGGEDPQQLSALVPEATSIPNKYATYNIHGGA
jgi:hypothetical protein